MIRVPSPIPEPADFDAGCRRPGNAWLGSHPAPAEVNYDLWSPFRDDLAAGFAHRCGYRAMLDTGGTVDHFFSRKTHRHLSYEWANYRYISQAANSSKQNLNNALLDPFEVEDDWFQVTLPDFQLRLTDRVPANIRAKAQFTIERLGLVNGPHILVVRRFWYDQHRNHGLNLARLLHYAPLVGRAVERWLQIRGEPLPDLAPPH